MKHNESEYLDKLFATSSDVTDEVEVDIPQAELSDGLTERLYGIAETLPESAAPEKTEATIDATQGTGAKIFAFPKFAAVAASLFVAVMGFQFYQQQKTLRQLEQAQADLATALQYLGEANRIARSEVLGSLQENMQKAAVKPAVRMSRDALMPKFNDRDFENKPRNHSL